jgi:hypothetical protein
MDTKLKSIPFQKNSDEIKYYPNNESNIKNKSKKLTLYL